MSDIYISPNFEGILYVQGKNIKGAILGTYEQSYDGVNYNLREMFISKELQGKGIGSRLFKEFETHLKEIGVTSIILFTSKENTTSNFYSKNEFLFWDTLAMMGKNL